MDKHSLRASATSDARAAAVQDGGSAHMPELYIFFIVEVIPKIVVGSTDGGDHLLHTRV